MYDTSHTEPVEAVTGDTNGYVVGSKENLYKTSYQIQSDWRNIVGRCSS